MKIPEQYLPVMPYLILSNAKEFAAFAKEVFGAKEQLSVPRDENTIMHAELRIHDAVIMYTDAVEPWKVNTAGMFIYVEDVDKVYNAAITKGAKSLMEPKKQDYGYTAGFEDPFGNVWWIVEAEK